MGECRTAILVTLVLVSAGCLGPAETVTTTTRPATDAVEVTVVDVVDGDTIDVRFANGTVDRVRLLGVDTPETHGETDPAEFEGVPDTDAGRACLRAAGANASDYLRERLAGERVRLVFDARSDRRGYYGRLLAYVRHGGSNVILPDVTSARDSGRRTRESLEGLTSGSINYRLVADGYARVYDSTFTQRDRFDAAEADAREGDLGVWRCREPTPTPDSDAALAVVTVHADAAGNDHENLDDEYVTFRNRGDTALNLTGWTVTDEAGHAYAFPAGYHLAAGEEVTLYTGAGTDTATELYWDADGAVWNNGGDTVVVTDENGTRRVVHEYE